MSPTNESKRTHVPARVQEAIFRIFGRTWRRLALRGQCDDFGGAEFRRVWAEYVAAGQPLLVAAFIRQHANRGSQREDGKSS
jgi:hypothetical protein